MRQIRTGVRIPVELPVYLRWKGPKGDTLEAQGKTGNISGNGLFATVPVRLRHLTPVTFTVVLPSGLTRIPVELLCKGRVVRGNRPGELHGVGAIIDDYEFRPAPMSV